MFHIDWPWMLLFLPLPWLFARWLPVAKQSGDALFLPFAVGVSASSQAGVSKRLWAKKLLLILCWLSLIFSATRPQWLGQAEPVATTGRRMMLAVDVSGSMQAKDMAGGASRLSVVQYVASNFVKGRTGDQIGLIVFGSEPYVQTPITPDLNTVEQFLQQTVVGIAGTQTNIGDAIGLAIKQLQNTPTVTSKQGDKVLVLVTDGASNAGNVDPIEAAKMAAKTGLKIYTIGVGAEVSPGFFGMSGNVDLDEDTLKKIANITGGLYFRATDADALQSVYAKIDQLEPVASRQQWVRPTTEWFVWPLAFALIFSVPAVVIRATAQ
jgi:Ca-activated chloride channel homolog